MIVFMLAHIIDKFKLQLLQLMGGDIELVIVQKDNFVAL